MASIQTVSETRCQAENSSRAGEVLSIGIAGLKVVRAPQKIRTVLGSCIGIAMIDRVAKLGGLGHVILPSSLEGSGDPRKFADTAVDLLLEMLLDAGAERERIAAKMVGGATMFGDESAVGLGARNADAVRTRLAFHSICLAGSLVGGGKGRKMLLDPETGIVNVQVIGEAPREL